MSTIVTIARITAITDTKIHNKVIRRSCARRADAAMARAGVRRGMRAPRLERQRDSERRAAAWRAVELERAAARGGAVGKPHQAAAVPQRGSSGAFVADLDDERAVALRRAHARGRRAGVLGGIGQR